MYISTARRFALSFDNALAPMLAIIIGLSCILSFLTGCEDGGAQIITGPTIPTGTGGSDSGYPSTSDGSGGGTTLHPGTSSGGDDCGCHNTCEAIPDVVLFYSFACTNTFGTEVSGAFTVMYRDLLSGAPTEELVTSFDYDEYNGHRLSLDHPKSNECGPAQYVLVSDEPLVRVISSKSGNSFDLNFRVIDYNQSTHLWQRLHGGSNPSHEDIHGTDWADMLIAVTNCEGVSTCALKDQLAACGDYNPLPDGLIVVSATDSNVNTYDDVAGTDADGFPSDRSGDFCVVGVPLMIVASTP